MVLHMSWEMQNTKRFIRERQLEILLFSGIVVGLFWWAARGTGLKIDTFIGGFSSAGEFLLSMFPPNFAILFKVMPRIIETLQMAVASIIIATAIALPLSFLAARNTSPSYPIYKITRLFLNLLRSIPTLLWALLFIAMIGLGPFPGILGLAAHCIGTLGKYFSESIENVNPEIIEATEATGANKIQIIIFTIIPELKSLFLGFSLYYFEFCIRTASMMGVVGAGGIGMELLFSIRLFRYQETLAILIIIVAMVTTVDTFSFIIRKRMIGLNIE